MERIFLIRAEICFGRKTRGRVWLKWYSEDHTFLVASSGHDYPGMVERVERYVHRHGLGREKLYPWIGEVYEIKEVSGHEIVEACMSTLTHTLQP